VGRQDYILDLVLGGIGDVQAKYHRLVLLVGPTGSAKTSTLYAIHSRTNAPIHNIGIDMPALMLEMSEKERATRLSRLLVEAVDSTASDIVLLDNIELLFEPKLKANPLELLKTLSKTRTVVAAWPGRVEGNLLTYARLGHPEHRRYDVDDLLIVKMDD
jgi:ABC-type uncharacterized transport system ATPase component